MRVLLLAVLVASATVLTPAVSATPPPASCPVTTLPEHPFTPPPPYPSDGNLWIGTSRLWTYIPEEGTWSALPHYTPGDPNLRQKLFWWSEGYDWRVEGIPELTVTGERLDGPAPPVTSDEHANIGWTNDSHHPFMVIGIFIPTLGCWKITGHYKGEELSYVVWVGIPECSSKELLTVMKPDEPGYADATELAQTLQAHGFLVMCVLKSKMVNRFEGQTGASFFRTDRGDFEVLFLPKGQNFDSLEVVERRENGRFIYTFQGSPPPTSWQPMDCAYQQFFGKHANQLLIASDRELAAGIARITGS